MTKQQFFRVIDEDLNLDVILNLKQLRLLANSIVKNWNLTEREKQEFNLYYDINRPIRDCIEICKTDNTMVIEL